MFLACAMAPVIAGAQGITAPITAPRELPALRLFEIEPPTSTAQWMSLKGADLWKPPVSGSELPRWTVGRTVTLNSPRGLALSAGVSGRRGDPMPLYLSQPAFTQNLPGGLITGPGTYLTQWDVTFGATAPVGTIGGVKVKAFGDVILPVTPVESTNPAARLLNSRAIRFGLVAIF